MKGIIADLDPANAKAKEVLANFRSQYGYITLAWYLGSAYDDVYIAAECLKKTGDDQDADGFRDCLYDITWNGVIEKTTASTRTVRSLDSPTPLWRSYRRAERNTDNQGYKVLGGAPTQ